MSAKKDTMKKLRTNIEMVDDVLAKKYKAPS